MEPPTLLVALRPSPDLDAALARMLPGVIWVYPAELTPETGSEVRAVLVGSIQRDLAGADLGRLPRVEFVQRLYTGMDGIPFERFPPGVRFAGNIGAYAPFVAEHAVGLALAAARDFPRAFAQARSGVLRPPPDQRLLWHRSAVILGYGEIGHAIARRLKGFEMQVFGLNRSGGPADDGVALFSAGQLLEALAVADFVFDVRPLTRSTEGTIDAVALRTMRPQAVYVNVGRAGTVREEDLYRHLLAHPEFRAAMDAWWDEDFVGGRIPGRFPLSDLPNFLGTPHSAGFGPGVDRYVLDRALENLERFFSGRTPLHLVDPSEYRHT